MSYVTVLEICSALPALLQSTDTRTLEGIVGQILFGASKDFDSVTQAPEGYYAQKPLLAPTEKTYYSNGSNFLHVHHFVELDDIMLGTSSYLGYARQRDNQTLEIGYLTKRPMGTQVVVSARWGFYNIPEDVKQAIIARSTLKIKNIPMSTLGLDELSVSEAEGLMLKNNWDSTVEKYRRLNAFAYS